MTWSRHHRFRHGQPPWWPEGEPWPPAGPPWAWRGMRYKFFWRLGFFFGFVFLLLLGASTIAYWIASGISAGGARPFFLIRPFGGLILLMAVFLAMLAVGRGVRRMAAPIGDVMDAAQRVAEGDYTVRVPERGPPEVRQLTRAFNTMVSRLRATDERRRSQLADISHDLRTPLTVIQGNLEGLLDGVYPRDDAHLRPVLEETPLLSAPIEGLPTLTLAEAGALPLPRWAVGLEAVLVDALAGHWSPGETARRSL